MPQFRRNGYGGYLLKLAAELALENHLKLRIWVAHVDSAHENFPVFRNLLGKVGLQLSPSTVRWASHVAESQ